MFQSTLGLGIFVLSTFLLILVFSYLKFTKRLADTATETTYNDPIEKALSTKGLYNQHGMVDAGDGKSVSPQTKRSKSFFQILS